MRGTASCAQPHAHLLRIWSPPHALTDKNVPKNQQILSNMHIEHQVFKPYGNGK